MDGALETLNSVDWKNLKHAKGSAEDLPDLLRKLASNDKNVRETSLHSLSERIIYQGRRYEASSYAVPFLYKLVEDRYTPARDSIVKLLVLLAVGVPDGFIPDGFPIKALRAQVAGLKENISAEDREAIKSSGSGPQYEMASYDAVYRGVPLLLKLIEESDPKLRRAAIYALSWFPEYIEISSKVLCRKLEALAESLDNAQSKRRDEAKIGWLDPLPDDNSTITDSETLDIAHGLLTLSLLSRSSESSFERFHLSDNFLLGRRNAVIRAAAAIAMANKPLLQYGPIEPLLEAASSSLQFGSIRRDGLLLHNRGDLCGYALKVLRSGDKQVIPRIVEALGDALSRVDNADLALEITSTMLSVMLMEKGQLIKKPADKLKSWQRKGIEAIAKNGSWEVSGTINKGYAFLLSEFGLPGDREGLLSYLSAAAAKDTEVPKIVSSTVLVHDTSLAEQIERDKELEYSWKWFAAHNELKDRAQEAARVRVYLIDLQNRAGGTIREFISDTFEGKYGVEAQAIANDIPESDTGISGSIKELVCLNMYWSLDDCANAGAPQWVTEFILNAVSSLEHLVSGPSVRQDIHDLYKRLLDTVSFNERQMLLIHQRQNSSIWICRMLGFASNARKLPRDLLQSMQTDLQYKIAGGESEERMGKLKYALMIGEGLIGKYCQLYGPHDAAQANRPAPAIDGSFDAKPESNETNDFFGP